MPLVLSDLYLLWQRFLALLFSRAHLAAGTGAQAGFGAFWGAERGEPQQRAHPLRQ